MPTTPSSIGASALVLDPRDTAAPEEHPRSRWSRWAGWPLSALALIGGAAAIAWTPASAFGSLLGLQVLGSLALLVWTQRTSHQPKRHLFPWLLLVAAGLRLGTQVTGMRLSIWDQNPGGFAERLGQIFAPLHPLMAAGLLECLLAVQIVLVFKTYERLQQASLRFEEVKRPERRQRIAAYERGGLITKGDARERFEALDREGLLLERLGRAVGWLKLESALVAGLAIAAFTLAPLVGVAYLQLSPEEARVQCFLPVLGWSVLLGASSMLSGVAVSLYALHLAAAHERSRGYLAYTMIRRVRTNRRGLLWVLAGLGTCAAFSVLFQSQAALPPFLVTSALLAIPLLAEVFEERRLRGPRECGENEAQDMELEQTLMLQGNEAPFRPSPVQLLYHSSFEESGELGGDRADRIERRIDLELTRRCRDLGVPFPRPVLRRARDEFVNLRKSEYAILVRGVPVARGSGIGAHESVLLTEPRRVRAAGFECRTDNLPGLLGLYPIVQREDLGAIKAADEFQGESLRDLDNLDLLLQHLDEVCRRNVRRFFGGPEVQRQVEGLRRQDPQPVDAVVPRLRSMQEVTELLQRLGEESVPVRDLELIFSYLARATQMRPDCDELAEALRYELRVDLCRSLTTGRSELPVATVEPELEAALAEQRLTSRDQHRLRQRARLAMAEIGRRHPESFAATPIFLVRNPRARRALWEVLHQPNLPLISVLSTDELKGVGCAVRQVTELTAEALETPRGSKLIANRAGEFA